MARYLDHEPVELYRSRSGDAIPFQVIHKFTEEMASSNFLHDIAFPVWRWWVEDASGVKGE